MQGELRPDVGQGDAADGGLARGPAAVGHAPPQAHPKVRLQGMYRDLIAGIWVHLALSRTSILFRDGTVLQVVTASNIEEGLM